MNIQDVLESISNINFSGNIVPHTWFKHIVYETAGGKKKADLLAINILADVVYWYRLSIIRDESSGQIVEYRKKFKGDKLQKSYNQYAEQFGTSKRAVKDSVDLLVALGCIRRYFENIEDAGLYNVMYLVPVPEVIEAFSAVEADKIYYTDDVVQKNVIPPTKKRNTSYKISEEVLPKNAGGPAKKRDTNTENIEINGDLYLIVRGAKVDSDFQQAFRRFCISDKQQDIDNTFYWVNANAEKYNSSLQDVIDALNICIEKGKEGQMSYLIGILRKKQENKAGKGIGQNKLILIYKYLDKRIAPHKGYIKDYEIDAEKCILYYTFQPAADDADIEAVADLFFMFCEDIKTEYDIELTPMVKP